MDRIPAHRAADLYARAAQRLEPPPRPAPAAQPPAPAPRAAGGAAPPPDLTAEEARTIAAYFPPAPALALKLYGPDRATQRVAPETLGSRLDLRG